ncbi:MAG: hypothetical protein WA625_24150 [Pseudolabrys sp.]
MPQATQRTTSERDFSDDLIWGISGKHGIAAFLKIPPAKAYYLISRGAIPVRRLGHRTIAASRSELRRHFTSNG